MADPNFNSGTGADQLLGWKRFLASPIGQFFGADPNAAVPQEAFRKIASGNVLNGLKLATQGMGQIRKSEIDLATKAAMSPDNSIAANRLLVEINDRLYARAEAIADLARSYKGGHLDPGFDAQARAWDRQHPLFTEHEQHDPRLIAPPVFENVDQARRARVRSGTPVQLPDGQIMMMP
jgi:hypothetical protein